MNESSLADPSDLTAQYPGDCVRKSLLGCASLGSDISSIRFALVPSYLYGFHILQGSYNVDTFMEAKANVSGIQVVPPWNANFTYTLVAGDGGLIGSGTATTVFNNWFPVPMNPPQYYVASANTHVSVSIGSPIALSPNETAYLTMTLLGLDSVHVATLEFHSGFSTPSRITLPADFYSSSVTISTPNAGSRLGEPIVLTGNLVNTWNNTAIASQTVYVETNCMAMNSGQTDVIQLGSARTSSAGGYSFSWTLKTPWSSCGFRAYWNGNSYFYYASSDRTVVFVDPASTTLTVGVSQGFGLTTNAYRIQGNLKGLNGSIAGADITLDYSVLGRLWSVLGSGRTDSSGNYAVTWIPTGTGNFTIRATYNGTTTQEYQEAMANLNVQSLYLGPNLLIIIPSIGAAGGIGTYLYFRRRRDT